MYQMLKVATLSGAHVGAWLLPGGGPATGGGDDRDCGGRRGREEAKREEKGRRERSLARSDSPSGDPINDGDDCCCCCCVPAAGLHVTDGRGSADRPPVPSSVSAGSTHVWWVTVKACPPTHRNESAT
jgi:hypothetical protein